MAIGLQGRLVCATTGQEFEPGERLWRSPAGGLLDVVGDVHLDWLQLGERPPTMWRYREALPIDHDEHVATLGEGCTPMVAAELAGRQVLLKLEYLSPTGSYKDRGAAVMLSKARELGIARVVEDSSGNAGAAVAAYAARAGIACRIFVPESTSAGKVAQISAHGAEVVRVPGSRADAAAAAWEAAQQDYYASHCWNPYFFQGTKTFAYEMIEQLGGEVPDAVVFPVGHGTLLLGAYRGFCELRGLGVIGHMPQLIAVQAAACAPLCDAWAARGAGIAGHAGDAQETRVADEVRDAREPRAMPKDEGQPSVGSAVPPDRAFGPVGETIAEGIVIADPVRKEQCIAAVHASGGTFLKVEEEAIRAGWREAARAGFYIEPTSAVAVAALRLLPADVQTVVVPLTGMGLKSTAAIEAMLS
jgi:threonine synthase